MMLSAINVESLVVGKELLLVLVGLCVVFVSCFVMGLISIGRSRKIVKTKDDYDDLMRKMANLSSQRDALVAEIQSRGIEREEYARATKFLEMQPHLVAEVEKLEKTIADKELTLKKLYEQLQSAEKKYDELKKISSEIMEMERDKAILDGERKEAERARDDMRKKVDDEGKKVDALRKEGKDLSGKNNALEGEIAKNQKVKEDLERKVKQLTQQQEEAKAWLEENKDKLKNRDDLDHQIDEAKKELERIDEKIKEGTKAVADTMDRIDKGLDRLNKMNLSGVQTLRQSAFASLKEGVFSIVEKKNSVNEDELDALATVADHMERSKFVVPERLLYAFHTSLKTSDMSSLTVMAGVSGTGKSAIPKLYSEAMGIHFQPLAVEPRWDSPKDLLGFFNYVTNRYEPTTLARALFQFQGLHSKDFTPDADMHDYMLMPMLDEMNLARIEYYFSEFLSKLEMRRLVAPLTQKNLGVVALEIFQGFSAKGEDGKMVEESPIRLFANQNTLFVGTMNEDETTQSLSDKVIDRANVLYFGRPDRLQAKAGGAGHNMPFTPIRKATWDSWRKNANEGELKFASDTLAALNRTLADFNRPFAHRTYQAMLSYIANYPVKSGEDRDDVIKRALADQIGMRIMPKLYGVDLALHQDTLAQVRRNLNEVGDPLLLRAFDSASDREQNKSGFFHWTGFDWNGR